MGVTSRRSTSLRVVLATVVALLLPLVGATAPPAASAAGDSGVDVVVTGLSPSSLTARGTLRMTGRITNTGTAKWTDLQAYLVIRPTPITSRDELADEVRADNGFAGSRIIDVGRFDEVGDLAPGASARFRIEVPVSQLPISGADGVYPVGVQVLGTDADGKRDTAAIARATTLLPRMTGSHRAARTTVVWPFVMPYARTVSGDVDDVDDLLRDIAPGGRLRTLLDLADATDPSGRGFVVDPALVSAVEDLSKGRAADRELTDDEQADATGFLQDLVVAAASPSAWILDYDRTDVLALSDDGSVRRRLFGAVERATDSVTTDHGLSRDRVSWPTIGGVDGGLLRSLRERGDDPVIVSSQRLPDWSTSDGVLVERSTSGGDLPLLVNDDVTAGIPGSPTLTTLRQRILAGAALASLEGGARESLVLVDPDLDPRTSDPATVEADADYLDRRPLSEVPRGPRYAGRVDDGSTRPLSGAQLAAVDAAARSADVLSAASVESGDLDDTLARTIADLLGVRWRDDRSAGLLAARTAGRRFAADLSSITVAGPPSVTLSSASGAFPLTISNDSDATVRVGVRLDSSNPALALPDQPTVEIAAGERRTVTVDVDLAEQNATTVTARLTTPDGRAFGSSDEFIIRSSRVGVVLWATMGAAALFVVFALVRRFRRRRSGRPASPAGEPDE